MTQEKKDNYVKRRMEDFEKISFEFEVSMWKKHDDSQDKEH